MFANFVLKVSSTFDTIGLTLAANNREISGRTTLQKLIYFETIKIQEINFPEPYFAYFYGPFNIGVAKSLERMVFYGLLEENRTKTNRGTYVYKVTSKGTKIIDDLENEFKNIFDKIVKLVDICNEYCGLNPNPLSFAAKVHYMLESEKTIKKSLSEDKLIDIGKSFGWKITQSDIKNGSQLLEKLELVKIKR